MCLYVLLFFCCIKFKHGGCRFECFHMVDSLVDWPGIVIVLTVSFHSGVTFLQFFHFWDNMGFRFSRIRFTPSILILGKFSLFGVTVEFLLLVVWKIVVFFAGFTGWSSSGFASTIDTLRGYSLVNGVTWDALLSWTLSWFTSVGFLGLSPWLALLEVLLGGLALLNFSTWVLNSSLYPFLSLTIRIAGAGFCRA